MKTSSFFDADYRMKREELAKEEAFLRSTPFADKVQEDAFVLNKEEDKEKEIQEGVDIYEDISNEGRGL